eukprot:gene11973-13965_t
MESHIENMNPKSGYCPAINHIHDLIKGTQKYKEYMDTKVTLQDQIFKALNMTAFPKHGWNSLADLFYAHQCHGMDFPAEMSSFFNDVMNNFRAKINGTIKENIMFFSGHDVTIIPFLNIFGFFDEIPPYASHLEMELWQDDVKEDTDDIDIPEVMFRRVNMLGHNTWQGNCSLGQLTQRGYKQHLDIGSKFRDLSTDVPRTLQSIQAEMAGLYPPKARNVPQRVEVVNIHTMDGHFDNLVPLSGHCPVLKSLYTIINGTQHQLDFNTKMAPMQDRIFKELKITTFPEYGWYSLMELFYALQCHDMDLPPGIDQSLVDQSYDATYWEAKYQLSFPFVFRLGTSSFVDEIVNNFRGKINGKVKEKIMFFSGHDDSVTPFVNIFGFLNELPPYASHVEMELWQDDAKGDYYLQFKYNGIVRILPGCTKAMCPVQTFFDITSKFIIPDYNNICHGSIDDIPPEEVPK